MPRFTKTPCVESTRTWYQAHTTITAAVHFLLNFRVEHTFRYYSVTTTEIHLGCTYIKYVLLQTVEDKYYVRT